MTAQPHKIMRQVLEVRGCPPDEERRIGSEVRGLYYQRVLPVIDKVCSEVGAPGRIHRVGRLEIDLGRVSLAGLDSHFGDRFEAVFSERLAAAIVGSAQADSDLELVDWFVRTGTLPWWADASEHDVLQGALAALLERAPRELLATLQGAPDPERARRRVTRACTDSLLEKLTVVMAPSLATACPHMGAWVAALRAAGGGGAGTTAVRHVVWEEVLRAAEAHGAPAVGAARFSGAVVVRVARRVGQDYPALVRALHRALAEDEVGAPAWAREAVDGLLAGIGAEAVEVPEGGDSDPARQAGGAVATGETGEPVDVAAGQAARLDPSAPAQGAEGPTDHVGGSDRTPATARDAAEPAEQDDRDGAPSPGRAAAPGETARQAGESGDAAREAAAPGETRRKPSRGPAASASEVAGESAAGPRTAAPRLDTTFSDIDAVFVENAGLVILWPFLERFFARLGLLRERRFRDEAAAHRAAGLLQHVAGTEGTPPEFLVPLNKVLCGIAPEEVFDFGDDITDAEAEECEDLLCAVIQQAPILRNMSTAGFRGSFLLRKGQLATRDGHWLLRVERETHDVVLERFPWGFSVVKLPWMAALLQVEW